MGLEFLNQATVTLKYKHNAGEGLNFYALIDLILCFARSMTRWLLFPPPTKAGWDFSSFYFHSLSLLKSQLCIAFSYSNSLTWCGHYRNAGKNEERPTSAMPGSLLLFGQFPIKRVQKYYKVNYNQS